MLLLGTLTLMLSVPISVLGAATSPDLGTAGSFGVLAGSAVTNTGPTTVDGDVGVSPGTSVSGFPPGNANGTIHAGDAVALQAHNDATTAYNDAAGQACDFDLTGQDLGGMTLIPGVYCFNSSAQLTGQLTLDGQGNSNSVFVFKIGSTLTTASNASVDVMNSADPCNVFWQVGSSATIGTNTDFAGNILALTSITVNTGAATSTGLYALNGAVTLDTNDIQACAFVQVPTNTPTSAPTGTATSTTVPSTNTSTPVATNTPASTATAIQTKTPGPRATHEPTETPGVIDTLTPIGTETITSADTAVPTDTALSTETVMAGDTATALALATQILTPGNTAFPTGSSVPPTTALATETAISTSAGTATGTAIGTTTSTSITAVPTMAIGTTTVAVTVTGTASPISTVPVPGDTPITTQTTVTSTPPLFLPPTGGGNPWLGSFALLLGMLLLLSGLANRTLFPRVSIKVDRVDEV